MVEVEVNLMPTVHGSHVHMYTCIRSSRIMLHVYKLIHRLHVPRSGMYGTCV